MSRRQTRKAVSVRGETYRRFKQYCGERSLSGVLEELIAEKLRVLGEPEIPPEGGEQSTGDVVTSP